MTTGFQLLTDKSRGAHHSGWRKEGPQVNRGHGDTGTSLANSGMSVYAESG